MSSQHTCQESVGAIPDKYVAMTSNSGYEKLSYVIISDTSCTIFKGFLFVVFSDAACLQAEQEIMHTHNAMLHVKKVLCFIISMQLVTQRKYKNYRSFLNK